MMTRLGTARLVAAMTAAAAGMAIALVSPAGPAYAASASAGKNNFQRECDAQVHVSDATSSGNVEVFGGFACPTGTGLWNNGVASTIKVIIIRNGVEIKNSTFTCPSCIEKFWTCSSESWQVTYPDYASTDRFKGKMVITSLGGSVTLTTGEIRT
jgi:hypothetical protein